MAATIKEMVAVIRKTHDDYEISANKVLMCVAISDDGQVAIEYFDGNYDIGWMMNFIKSHCYVNGWNCTIQNIVISEEMKS